MTSKTTMLTHLGAELERFPDYPPRDDMQNWLHLYETSIVTSLAIHFADEPDVTVASEVPACPSETTRGYPTCWWSAAATVSLWRSSGVMR